MRWLTYKDQSGTPRVGILVDQKVHGTEPGLTMTGLLADGPDSWKALGTRLNESPDHAASLPDITVELPLEPRSIRDSAGFIQHLRNVASSTGRVIDDNVPAVLLHQPCGSGRPE